MVNSVGRSPLISSDALGTRYDRGDDETFNRDLTNEVPAEVLRRKTDIPEPVGSTKLYVNTVGDTYVRSSVKKLNHSQALVKQSGGGLTTEAVVNAEQMSPRIRSITLGGRLFLRTAAAERNSTIPHPDPASRTLYRGDGRPPEEILKNGFRSWNQTSNLSLKEHVIGEADTREDTNFISTSKSFHQAKEALAGLQDGYVYTLQPKAVGVDINNEFGDLSPHQHEQEVLFANSIPSDEIRSATQVSESGEIGSVVTNLNFDATSN